MPTGVVEAVLREHLGDDGAALTDLVATPIPGDGFSGNRLYRVRLTWASGRQGGVPGSASGGYRADRAKRC